MRLESRTTGIMAYAFLGLNLFLMYAYRPVYPPLLSFKHQSVFEM